MSFKSLYSHVECSTKSNKIIVIDRDVVPFLLETTAQDHIKFYEVDLDTSKSLGHFKQTQIPGGAPYSSEGAEFYYEVRYARSLNTCWRRFVCCKELLHVYDQENQRSNTKEKFIQLVKEIALPQPTSSAMYTSEVEAMWKAMAVLAPQRLRNKFRATYDAGQISDYELALHLRIPEFYIAQIMSQSFDRIIDSLISRN